ncbi:transglutaminase domain-containing protein [Seonamhaeicola sediminis]|uniref:Transglutaminase domain-containing protein n=1 Tax=Seonamhaeicola sediminis TaxID=2528206 RepID=A0A562YH22_9FLAO|nr:transglutaminase domain-containing protein [Seonamhaeicola sediminis]TWO34360.1 transglutaminase domain-containing protein [Seonamhaeicola sediminis]
MLKVGKKIIWLVKRHPYLYYTRFKLLSKEASQNEAITHTYNLINKKQHIPKSFHIVNAIILKGKVQMNTFNKVLEIAKWLRLNIKGGSGLSLSSEKALEKMLAGEGGVCSDISQVFNNFCVVNDIKVREWGITSLPFNRTFGGHAFNEFYSEKFDKWVLIDVSKTMMFFVKGSDIPLSVMELFACNKSGEEVIYKSFLESNKVDDNLISHYYLNGDRAPFLICNYHNETYDKYLDRYHTFLPVFVIHFWLFLIKKSYFYIFPINNLQEELVYQT